MAKKPKKETTIRLGKPIPLAYAENRCQNPADLLPIKGNRDPLAMHKFKVVSGEPSYIAIADGSQVVNILGLLQEACAQSLPDFPYIVIAGKHGNPCGVGISWHDKKEAITKCLFGDPVAVMGGEVVTNFAINENLAIELYDVPLDHMIGRKHWGLDLILAPSFDKKAIDLLGKKAKRRLLAHKALLKPSLPPNKYALQPVRGGFLRQSSPRFILDIQELTMAGKTLSADDFATLLIAWAVCWRASSNTVTLAKDGMLIGSGCGQQDRIACVRLCLERANRAGHDTKESLFASDGFFPYAQSSAQNNDPEWSTLKACLSGINDLYHTYIDKKSILRKLTKLTNLVSKLDNREGPELLIATGCKGGVVPADGKNLAEVQKLFAEAGLSVAFVDKENRGFSKH